ncbi:MAG: flagellin [Myxococcota bacterium]|nr:flagellin [Myxococcota bacterium]
MSLRVRTNIASIRSFNSLNRTQKSLTNSLERISSGLRVNRAADDAAGLAVASRMNADNVSLRQAMRNANDGISLVQTAEGTLNQIGNILTRMRELSIQSANGTYSDGDRLLINTEFAQLASELNRIASISNFNGINLLRASTGAVNSVLTLQIGIDNVNDDRISLRLTTLAATGAALGLATVMQNGITSQLTAQGALDLIDTAIQNVNVRRATLGATQNRLESALSEASTYSENLSASYSQIMDVDYAEESANMTRLQIMQQAGVAALGQAKTISQSVVSLLS